MVLFARLIRHIDKVNIIFELVRKQCLNHALVTVSYIIDSVRNLHHFVVTNFHD
jgi:hypothetical protein